MIVKFEDRDRDTDRAKARALRAKATVGKLLTNDEHAELMRLESAEHGRAEGRLILA